MLKRYRGGIVPQRHDELAADAARASDSSKNSIRHYRLQQALLDIQTLTTRANQYVDQTAPFKLAKDPAQAERLDQVLYNLVESCRILAVLLWPFLPETAVKIYAQLGLKEAPDLLSKTSWGGLQQGHPIGEPAPLFPRRDAVDAKGTK